MSQKIFTEEPQQLLRQNPYIFNITDTRINLTREFKDIFMDSYKASTSPRKILEDHGFDIDLIGERCIWSVSQHIRTEYKKYSEFHEGYRIHRSYRKHQGVTTLFYHNNYNNVQANRREYAVFRYGTIR